MKLSKGYTDGPYGQIHWRIAAPENPKAPDLFCFHPVPFSGLAYTTIMPFLSKDRRVIAPDYPGYGGSDPFVMKPSIEDYAAAMMAVVDDLSGSSLVDVLGFHTGCLVATEVCLNQRDRFRKAALIDIPALPEEVCSSLIETNAQPLELTASLDCLAPAWKSGVTNRLESQSMARAFEMFVEQIRPGEAMNAAFYAAFSYDWQKRFLEHHLETLVLATQSFLLEGSRKAAGVMPNAVLVERLDIKRAVLDEAAERTANEVLRFL